MVGFRGLQWIYDVTEADEVATSRAQAFQALISARLSQPPAYAALTTDRCGSGSSNAEGWTEQPALPHDVQRTSDRRAA